MKDKMIVLVLLCCSVQLAWTSTRHDRIWPISGTTSVDLAQSSPYGPRLKISENSRYDFHRGIDIPTALESPIYAIDDGKVLVAGRHRSYSDPLVQIEHKGWAESAGTRFYSYYMHMLDGRFSVSANQNVRKGQLIGHSGASSSGFPHLHFEIRVGRRYEKFSCNPWKYLPNPNNDYFAFTANFSLTSPRSCKAIVNISVPPNQLTFDRLELHMDYGSGDHMYVYDMCYANMIYHDNNVMDRVKFGDNLRISPRRFNSQSYGKNEWAAYGFEFFNLPEASPGTMYAKAYDVFGNSVRTASTTYNCN